MAHTRLQSLECISPVYTGFGKIILTPTEKEGERESLRTLK